MGRKGARGSETAQPFLPAVLERRAMRFLVFLPLMLVAVANPAWPAMETDRPSPTESVLASGLAEHGGPVRALAVAADGRSLASGGFDERLLVRRASNELPHAVRAHGGGVSALISLPTSVWASGGEDGRVLIWADLPNEAPARVLAQDGAAVTALAARGRELLATGRDGSVRFWRLHEGAGGVAAGPAATRLLGHHEGAATAAAFRTSDGAPVTAGADGSLRVWRDDGASDLLFAADAPITALLALPDGSLAAAGANGAVLLVRPDGSVRDLPAGDRPVPALAISQDGSLLLAGSLGGGATLWNLPEGSLRTSLADGGVPVWSVALSPDGTVAWTGGADGRVTAWDARTGRFLSAGAVDSATDGGSATADQHGARVFRACGACHALRADAPPKAGPHLAGIFGRRMGTLENYGYSPRLARGDILWTPESVSDLFTRGPAVVVPGTRMPDQRVRTRKTWRRCCAS